MSIAEDIDVTFDAFIVPIDVPLLIGPDMLRNLRLRISFGDGTLLNDDRGWKIKLALKLGHLYVEWLQAVDYTASKLRRIHRNVYHPHFDKLVNLINRGAQEHAKPGIRENLEKVHPTCETCQRLSIKPGRFRIAMPHDDYVFNRIAGLEITKFSNRSVLHMVDRDTKLSAATLLHDESSKNNLESFLCCWVATYMGYPDEVMLDQGPQFQSAGFQSHFSAANMKRRDTGVEVTTL